MKEKIEELINQRDVRIISHDTFVNELLKLINKPVETVGISNPTTSKDVTNEQPKLTEEEINILKKYPINELERCTKSVFVDKLLEENKLKKLPIVYCCNPFSKCNCDTYDEINSCPFGKG